MYAKVFAQIFDSSIADNYPLRHFFMDLLVLADADGFVDMTPTAIAARTRIPLTEVTAMLATLEQPDRESRTPDADGRRLERLDEHRTWGWRIINYGRFRQIASDEQRKASQRERFSRWKSKRSNTANAPLTPANAANAMQRQKQRQKQTEKQQRSAARPVVFHESINTPEFKAAWEGWLEHLKQKRKPATVQAQVLQLKKLAALGSAKAIGTINHCIEKNWQGIYEPKAPLAAAGNSIAPASVGDHRGGSL